MANTYFQFKQFIVQQDKSAMKVTTDGCLFGAWVAEKVSRRESLVMSRGALVDESSIRSGELRRVLDIGTGTGLLSLMLAQRNPGLLIDAIEIDTGAAVQAKENSDASPWKDRVTVICQDAREFASEAGYDYIVSNPPFYEKELRSENNQRNLAHHSDALSLDVLVKCIKNNLNTDGQFFLLLPFKRDVEIKALLNDQGCFISDICFVRQSVSHDYFRIMLAASFNNGVGNETAIGEISIKDKEGQYTPGFVGLLKDYYLHL
jgi:tRNA1Val (adenine37-N6)-methyltransferase